MGILAPTKEQWQELMQMDLQGPIVMVNLLKFKPDGGEATYEIYEKKVMALMADKGLEAPYVGTSFLTVIGEEEWDKVILAHYPSLQAFIDMNRDPAYMEIVQYRMDALSDSRLILTRQN